MEEIIETPAPEPSPDKGMERHAALTEQFNKLEQEQAEPAKSDAATPSRVDGRDQHGRFAPKPSGEQPPDGPAPVEEPVWRKPPKSWKPELHEVWKTLDPKAQEYAHAREDEMRRGVESVIPKARFADAVQKAMAPYSGTMRSLGIDPPQAIAGLMKADHILRTSDPQTKLQYFHKLAQQYGVNLDGSPALQGQAEAQISPVLMRQLTELQEWKNRQEAEKTQQEQALNQALATDIERFAADPKNEHFEAVRLDMAMLIDSGKADTLDAAYKKALRLDDSLFALTHAQPSAPQENSAAVKDRAARVAKSAAVSVKGSAPGAHPRTKAQDRRSKLIEQFDGLSERL